MANINVVTVSPVTETNKIITNDDLQATLSGKVDDNQVLTDVPAGALFTDTNTDTIYDDTTIQAEVDLNTAKVGITAQQATDITDNNAKVTYPSEDSIKLTTIEDNANDYSHPNMPGTYHIPSGGTVGQVLKNTSNGSATWQDEDSTDISGKEDDLGNPATDGYILTSTTAGVRTWVANSGGGGGIPSDTGLVANSTAITNIVGINQADYDALGTYDSGTYYIITGS